MQLTQRQLHDHASAELLGGGAQALTQLRVRRHNLAEVEGADPRLPSLRSTGALGATPPCDWGGSARRGGGSLDARRAAAAPTIFELCAAIRDARLVAAAPCARELVG